MTEQHITQTQANNEEQAGSITLHDIIRMVVANWYWFVLSAVFCLCAAYYYLASTPKIYNRTATIMVKDSRKGGDVDLTAFSDLAGFQNRRNVDNEVFILQSRRLMTDVVKRLNLTINYSISERLRRRDLYGQAPIDVKFINDNDKQSLSMEITPLEGDKIRLTEFNDKFVSKHESRSVITAAYGDTIPTPVGQVVVNKTLYMAPDYLDVPIRVSKRSLSQTTNAYRSAVKSDVANKQASVVTVTMNNTVPRRAEDVINTLISAYNDDAIEDKRTYKRQIVGRHDSFGKIFAVTQELDVLNPRDIYRKCCELMGEILENDSVTIYRVSGGAFARLVAASPAVAEDAPRSLALEQLAPLLGNGGRSNLWVNRELTSGLPMFGYRIERDGAPAVLIFVRRAAKNQMTLYYQNLFRILCGLVESALGRAFDYEAVAQDKRCVAGTCVLKQEAFGQELAAEQALADNKMGSFLLLRVVPGMEPIGELVGAIGSAIRESDAAGLVDGDVLYLLMRQAKACDLPVIRERLSAKQIAVEPVDGEDIVALLQHIADTGDGEGDVA